MATYRAIAATSSALVLALRTAAAAEFGSTFRVELAQAVDLQSPPPAGSAPSVTVHLYGVTPAATRRGGPRRPPALSLDLHYLVTPWAHDSLPAQGLLGWIIRTLEDHPILPTATLNAFHPEAPVFGDDETVEVVWEPLSVEQLAAVWAIAPHNRQPSGTYVARPVQLGGEEGR